MQQGCGDDGEPGKPIGAELKLEELPRQANQQRNSAGQQRQIEWPDIGGTNAPGIAQKQMENNGSTGEQGDGTIFSVFFQPAMEGCCWTACIELSLGFQSPLFFLVHRLHSGWPSDCASASSGPLSCRIPSTGQILNTNGL